MENAFKGSLSLLCLLFRFSVLNTGCLEGPDTCRFVGLPISGGHREHHITLSSALQSWTNVCSPLLQMAGNGWIAWEGRVPWEPNWWDHTVLSWTCRSLGNSWGQRLGPLGRWQNWRSGWQTGGRRRHHLHLQPFLSLVMSLSRHNRDWFDIPWKMKWWMCLP